MDPLQEIGTSKVMDEEKKKTFWEFWRKHKNH